KRKSGLVGCDRIQLPATYRQIEPAIRIDESASASERQFVGNACHETARRIVGRPCILSRQVVNILRTASTRTGRTVQLRQGSTHVARPGVRSYKQNALSQALLRFDKNGIVTCPAIRVLQVDRRELRVGQE